MLGSSSTSCFVFCEAFLRSPSSRRWRCRARLRRSRLRLVTRVTSSLFKYLTLPRLPMRRKQKGPRLTREVSQFLAFLKFRVARNAMWILGAVLLQHLRTLSRKAFGVAFAVAAFGVAFGAALAVPLGAAFGFGDCDLAAAPAA